VAWQNDGIGVRRCCTSSMHGCDVGEGGNGPIGDGSRVQTDGGRGRRADRMVLGGANPLQPWVGGTTRVWSAWGRWVGCGAGVLVAAACASTNGTCNRSYRGAAGLSTERTAGKNPPEQQVGVSGGSLARAELKTAPLVTHEKSSTAGITTKVSFGQGPCW